MEVLLSGTQFPHEKGEFSNRKILPYYGVFCFCTPFLYERDGVLHRGNPGDLLINPPGSIVYHGAASQEECYINDWLHIAGDFGTLLERYPLPCNTALELGPQNIISSAIRQINEEQLLTPPGFQEKIDCILTQMVIELYRLYIRSPEQTADARIAAARETVLKSPERCWTLQQMADLSGYSPSRFSALYTSRFGRSPKSELLEARLSMAKQMLSYSDLSVSVIACACGFQSLYYFSKYFRQHTGLSPSAYATQFRGAALDP